MTRGIIQTAVKEGIPFLIRMADGQKYQVADRYRIALGKTTVIVMGKTTGRTFFRYWQWPASAIWSRRKAELEKLGWTNPRPICVNSEASMVCGRCNNCEALVHLASAQQMDGATIEFFHRYSASLKIILLTC
jgi:hypothetical protein